MNHVCAGTQPRHHSDIAWFCSVSRGTQSRHHLRSEVDESGFCANDSVFEMVMWTWIGRSLNLKETCWEVDGAGELKFRCEIIEILCCVDSAEGSTFSRMLLNVCFRIHVRKGSPSCPG